MHKLFLTFITIFSFSNGMEPQQPPKRTYNPEATEKLRNLFVRTTMQKLTSWIPNNIREHFISLKRTTQDVKELIEEGADPNIIVFEESPGRRLSALSIAICYTESTNLNLIHALLRHGANPNICFSDSDSILICAVKKDSPEAIEALLAHGAILDYKDRNGQTALDHAKSASTKQALSKQKIQ